MFRSSARMGRHSCRAGGVVETHFGGTLIVATEHTLAHYAAESGERLWQRDDFKKLAPFNVTAIAGTPYLLINEHLSSIPPKGRLQVLDIMSGKTLWDTGEVPGFNLGVYPVIEKNLVMFVFDRTGGGGVKSGNYIAGGLLSGGIGGAFKGAAGGGDRSDPPIDIETYGNNLIVRGQYHVLAHDASTRTNPWSIEFAPPGMNSFALIAMGAVTAAAAVGNMYGSAGTPGMASSYAQSTQNLTGSYASMVSARYAAAEKARNIAFFMTREEKQMMLVGIDLTNGQEIGEIPMTEKEPTFKVDAISNRVYYFRDKTQIAAYDF